MQKAFLSMNFLSKHLAFVFVFFLFLFFFSINADAKVMQLTNIGSFPFGTVFRLELNGAEEYMYAFYDGANLAPGSECAAREYMIPNILSAGADSCPVICSSGGYYCESWLASKQILVTPLSGDHRIKFTLLDLEDPGCSGNAVLYAKRFGQSSFSQVGSFVMDNSTPGNACYNNPDYWENLPEAARSMDAFDSSTFIFTINPPVCTGPGFTNAEMYPGDNTGLTDNLQNILVNAGTSRKCEWHCVGDYHKEGSMCVRNTAPVAPTCPQLGLEFVSPFAKINGSQTDVNIVFSCKTISALIPSGDKVFVNKIELFDASQFLLSSISNLAVECSKTSNSFYLVSLNRDVPASYSFALSYGGKFSGFDVNCTKTSSVSSTAPPSNKSIPDSNALLAFIVMLSVIFILTKRKRN